jgi:hypothetical protein
MAEITTAGIATDSVVRQATMSRASMLRPSGSVPRMLAHPCASVNGGWLELSRSMWVARLPTSIGPTIAVRKTSPSTTAAAAATRSLTNSWNHFERLRVSGSPTIAVVGLTGTRSSWVLMVSP